MNTKIHVEEWGDGTPVVLVHGSLALGAEEWDVQRPLADKGFRLVVFDRRGYGANAALADGEDFVADAGDVADLLGDGAHLVGHSYGGLGAIFAAARRPSAVRSLTLLEPGVFDLAKGHREAEDLLDTVRALWETDDLTDEEWVVRFLVAVGSDPSEFPPDFLGLALPLVPVFRRGRPLFDTALPLDELASASFPKLVVTGGHNVGFDVMCDDLASRIGAARAEVTGAGHEIQFAEAINDVLLELWSSVDG